jgi:DNA-binding response OmpR family regulator
MSKLIGKILIVEDEDPLRRVLTLKLGKVGFETKIAEDGKEALDVLAKETFDLILLDLMIPKKNGFMVLTDLRARNDNTPVIALTVLNQEEDIKKAKDLGVKDYVIKQQTAINDIVDKVKKYKKQ